MKISLKISDDVYHLQHISMKEQNPNLEIVGPYYDIKHTEGYNYRQPYNDVITWSRCYIVNFDNEEDATMFKLRFPVLDVGVTI